MHLEGFPSIPGCFYWYLCRELDKLRHTMGMSRWDCFFYHINDRTKCNPLHINCLHLPPDVPWHGRNTYRLKRWCYWVKNQIGSSISILNLTLAFIAWKTFKTVEIVALLFPLSSFEIWAFCTPIILPSCAWVNLCCFLICLNFSPRISIESSNSYCDLTAHRYRQCYWKETPPRNILIFLINVH